MIAVGPGHHDRDNSDSRQHGSQQHCTIHDLLLCNFGVCAAETGGVYTPANEDLMLRGDTGVPRCSRRSQRSWDWARSDYYGAAWSVVLNRKRLLNDV